MRKLSLPSAMRTGSVAGFTPFESGFGMKVQRRTTSVALPVFRSIVPVAGTSWRTPWKTGLTTGGCTWAKQPPRQTASNSTTPTICRKLERA